MRASLSRARSWSVAMRNGGDGLGPDVHLRCTYRVPRIDLRACLAAGGSAGASGSCRSEAASAVLAPHRRDHEVLLHARTETASCRQGLVRREFAWVVSVQVSLVMSGSCQVLLNSGGCGP